MSDKLQVKANTVIAVRNENHLQRFVQEASLLEIGQGVLLTKSINPLTGLKSPQIRALKRQNEQHTSACIMAQVAYLGDCLTTNGLKDSQVVIACRNILEKFEDFSLIAIQDCFNKLVNYEEPFHNYKQGWQLTVTEIGRALKHYREFQAIKREELKRKEKDAYERKQIDPLSDEQLKAFYSGVLKEKKPKQKLNAKTPPLNNKLDPAYLDYLNKQKAE